MLRDLSCPRSALRTIVLRFALIVALAYGAFSSPCAAQDYMTQIGTPEFTPTIPIENGFINVANGDIHIEIPIDTVPQRGHLRYTAKIVYDSRIWGRQPGNFGAWAPLANSSTGDWWLAITGMGAQGIPGVTPTSDFTAVYMDSSINCGGSNYSQKATGFQLRESDGTIHYFPNIIMYQNVAGRTSGCFPVTSSASSYPSDGSGYLMNVSWPSQTLLTITVLDKFGTQVYPSYVDSNGNEFSQDANHNTMDSRQVVPVQVTTNGNTTYLDVLNSTGSRSRYTLTYETISASTNFQVQNAGEWSGTLTVLQSVTRPDGSSWSFGYDSGTSPGHYGELTSMTLPQGGTVNFGYTNFQDSLCEVNRWVSSRTSGGGTWTYTPASLLNPCDANGTQPSHPQQVTVRTPVGDTQVYSFSNLRTFAQNTEVDYYNGSAGSPIKKELKDYYTTAYWLPLRLTTSLLTSAGSYITKKQEYTWQQNPGYNLTQVKEWDFYTGTPPTNPYRTTTITYNSNSSYAARNLISLPSSIVVTNSGGTVSQTNYGYDATAIGGTSGVVEHDYTHYPSTYTIRGNQTSISRWVNTTNSYVMTTNYYDDLGNLIQTSDPKGNSTSYSYADDWSPNAPSCVSGAAETFLTTITYPDSVTDTTVTKYNACDGSVYSVQDQNDLNNNRAGILYTYDGLGRLTNVSYPDGGNVATAYGTSTPIVITRTATATPSPSVVTTQTLDGLGRTTQTALTSDPSGADKTVTTYDAAGRIASITNPYRSTSDPTYGVTTYTYDGLDRTCLVVPPGGTAGTGTCPSAPISGDVTTIYGGRATEVTDESGKQRISQVDGLGRLAAVCEITSATLPVGISGSTTPVSCGFDVSGTGFLTTYGYDTLGDLTSVSQAPLNPRSFNYDSLGRLLTANNPESGQTNYTYDANGNVATVVAPLPNQTGSSTVTTTYSYDALNRLTQKTYSDSSTPTALYGYGTTQITMGSQQFTIANTTGRLAWDCVLASPTSCGTMAAYSYDPMGRIAQRWQENPVNNNNIEISYTYDQIGDELTRNIGSEGFAETYDGAGGLTSFTQTDYTDATNPPNLLSGATYDPVGHMVLANLGNSLSESWKYDNRGRLAAKAVGTGCTAGAGTCTTTKYSTSAAYVADGSVMSANDTANGNWVYSYDDFNRLISSTGGPNNYAYAYVYDRFGNKWKQTLNGGCTAGTAFCIGFDANNRMTNSTQTYDAAGNVLSDSMHTYSYL